VSSDEQTQAADDPSGPEWRDVGPDEILQTDDRFWVVDHWEATQNVGTKSFRYGTGYRRRIEQQQQQPSESEPVIDHRRCVEALQQISQLGDTDSKVHKERFCPNGEGDGIANGWRVAEAMREVANSVVGGVSLQQQPSDSEPETMEQLREQVRDLTRQVQFDAVELQQLREQVQTLTRELSDAVEARQKAEHELATETKRYRVSFQDRYKAGQQAAAEALQTWLRPVLELVAEHPEDASPLAVAVLGYLPGIASRLIEE
jgi:FtsZ-binding cell division protein ZapB